MALGRRSPASAALGSILRINTVLTVAEALNAVSSDAIPLSQQHQMAVQECSQGLATDALVLLQQHMLTPANATHGVASGAPTLSQVHEITVHGAGQSITTAAISLTQVHALHVQSSTADLATDAVLLSQLHAIDAQNCVHAHDAGGVSLQVVALNGSVVLLLDDAAHGVSSGSAALTQHHIVLAIGSRHLISSDLARIVRPAARAAYGVAGGSGRRAVRVKSDSTLSADRCLHAMQSAVPALTQQAILELSPSRHAVVGRSMDLTQHWRVFTDDDLMLLLIAAEEMRIAA